MKPPKLVEKDGKIAFELFDHPAWVDVRNPPNGLRQMVRIVKILEQRIESLAHMPKC